MFTPPKFKSLDTDPIDPVYFIQQHASAVHCANISRLAADYGWDMRLLPQLIRTGISQHDREILAAAICQGRRLFCEATARTVFPALPHFDSNALMAYTILSNDNPDDNPVTLSPEQIRIAALEQALAEKESQIEQLTAALTQNAQTLHNLTAHTPATEPTDTPSAQQNDQLLPADNLTEARTLLAQATDNPLLIEHYIHLLYQQPNIKVAIPTVVNAMRLDIDFHFNDLSIHILARIFHLCCIRCAKGNSEANFRTLLSKYIR